VNAPWTVQPYVGVGPLRLGATRAELEQAVGVPCVPVDRGYPLPSAVFATAGVQAHFRADGLAEAFELMAPAVPELDGLRLLDIPYARVRSALQERDPGVVLAPDGLTSAQLGVGLYAPLATERPELPAEGVIVFVRGYDDG
jgi:hypothetical protein